MNSPGIYFLLSHLIKMLIFFLIGAPNFAFIDAVFVQQRQTKFAMTDQDFCSKCCHCMLNFVTPVANRDEMNDVDLPGLALGTAWNFWQNDCENE